MIFALAVPQVHRVGLTRASAVQKGVPIGEKSAEDAVLRVEDRQMLMHNCLQLPGPAAKVTPKWALTKELESVEICMCVYVCLGKSIRNFLK